MSLGGILGTALLVTLTRPATWLVALAGFLIRGGIVWFLIPIVALPTPVGLANALGPSIVEFVFGGLTLGVVLLLIAGAGVGPRLGHRWRAGRRGPRARARP